jgi:hypothetical protein
MIAIGFAAASPAHAANLFVKHDAAGPEDGLSWPNAFRNLETALSSAAAGDTIYVARGTYKPTTGSDDTISFVINKHNLTLRGGYEGVHPQEPPGNILPGRRSPGSEFLTILSGDINSGSKPGLDEGNSQHVIKVVGPFPNAESNADQSVIINGFVITMGYADGDESTDDNRGGGILVSHAIQGPNDLGSTAVRLVYCTVKENQAGEGGGMYIQKGGEETNPVRVFSCAFQGNEAHDLNPFTANGLDGGAIAMTGEILGGGGTGTPKGFVEIANSLFHSNGCDDDGGAIWVASKVVSTIVNATVADNDAGLNGASTGFGGGIHSVGGIGSAVTITNSIFWGNHSDGASSLWQISGTPTVTYSDVQGSSSTANGNVNIDPDFVNAAGGDDHLDYGSPVKDLGQGTDASWNPPIPDDTLDVDDDLGTAEPAPTGDRQPRARAASSPAAVDMGSFELQGLCRGDCAAYDGRINVTDQLLLLAGWGQGGACDIDNDGEVDNDDLLALIAAWGTCPAGGEAAMMNSGDEGLLELIVVFIESVGGASDQTVPLIIEFLQHLQ